MKSARNTVLTFALLFALLTVGYYFHRKGVEEEKGNSYSFGEAPGDLISEIGGIFKTSDPKRSSRVRPLPVAPGPGEVPDPRPGRDPAEVLAEARAEYLAGRYNRALPLFERAAADGSPSEMLLRTRLFRLLLRDLEPSGALDGPPQAFLTLAGGDPFIAEVVSESDAEVTFRRQDGIGARVKKSELRDHRIARTPAEKRALGEAEYKRRHAGMSGSEAFLDLARFCVSYDLADHLTYLLERGLDEPGDTFASELFEAWKEFRDDARHQRAEEAADLLKHFFRTSEYARHAVTADSPRPQPPPLRPGLERADPVAADDDDDQPSGIGSVKLRKPRVNDPALNAKLDEAERLRKDANAHYMQAQPGSPNRAMHRDKALKAYEEAIALYEAVEDGWGVDLERIFKEILERRYQLLKDKPIR